jgi:hypothetical protein
MLKQNEHGDLRGLDRWCILPYVHKEDCCVVVCVIEA